MTRDSSLPSASRLAASAMPDDEISYAVSGSFRAKVCPAGAW